MAGTCVEKIACTNPNCGSSDGMQVYHNDDGTYSASCFVCQHYEPNPYGDQERPARTTMKAPTNDNDKIASIHVGPVAKLDDRGLLDTVAQYYGVKADAAGTRHYYPYYRGLTFTGYKERVKQSKDFYSLGDLKKVDLFGQSQAAATGSPRLVITEGELDCLAAFQMLWLKQQGTEYADNLPAVVSLPHGSSAAAKDLAEHADFLDRFKEIVLCFDNDDAGREAVQEAMRVLPIERVKVAKFTAKDACDMLQAGHSKAFCHEILFKAQPYRPGTIKTVSEVYEKATTMPTYGKSAPWETLNTLLQGTKPGDMIGVAAGVGSGKSTVWHKWMSHHVMNNDTKVGVCFLEEDTGDSLKNIATFIGHKRFISADAAFTQEELSTAIKELDGKVFMFEDDHHTLRDQSPWDSVKIAIRHLVLVEGCTEIVVDPLTALVAQMTSSEANDALNHIMAEMEAMTASLGFTFYYGAHLNPPRTGLSHEEGGRVYLSQLTGSRAMIKWSQIIIGLERDTQADDVIERNTTTVRLLKGRKIGATGTFRVYYNPEDGSFNELSGGQDRDYSAFTPTMGDREL